MPVSRQPLPCQRPFGTTPDLARALAACALRENRVGPETHAFEGDFATWIGARHAVALPAVRVGVHLALRALGLPTGSAVLCTSLTVFPVVDAIQRSGFRPVFVDLDPRTFSMDARLAAAGCPRDASALLHTHLWGQVAPPEPLVALARERGLALLEDGSQCLGGRASGRAVGTFGRAGLFSLGLTKPVNSILGAILVTDDQDLAEAVRVALIGLPLEDRGTLLGAAAQALGLRWLTSPPVYGAVGAPLLRLARDPRLKRHLDSSAAPAAGDSLPERLHAFGDLQARAGGRALARFDSHLARQRALAGRYRRDLAGIPGLALYEGPEDHEGSQWVFPVFHPAAERLRAALARFGIEVAPPAMHACHALPERPDLQADLPVASRLFRECLCLPLHPGMTEVQLQRVVEALRRCCSA